jgi:hypothetical protein
MPFLSHGRNQPSRLWLVLSLTTAESPNAKESKHPELKFRTPLAFNSGTKLEFGHRGISEMKRGT